VKTIKIMKRPRLNQTELDFIAGSLRLREKNAHNKFESVEELLDKLKDLKEKMRREGPKWLKEFKATKEEYLRERKQLLVYAVENGDARRLARRFEGLLNNRRLHVHLEPKPS